MGASRFDRVWSRSDVLAVARPGARVRVVYRVPSLWDAGYHVCSLVGYVEDVCPNSGEFACRLVVGREVIGYRDVASIEAL
ncbi:hypothetical protein GCM10010466_29200 [Planomonospora alba]|uniref:Uncharacterized protein n=1 Tax=Planomonospora alba TaxID=161354 RepID=A0ABP6N5E6_9ACTN